MTATDHAEHVALWCTCSPFADDICEYRKLADKIIELFNPPDDDVAEVALVMDAVVLAAEFIEIVYKWLEAHRADPETPRPPQVEFDADSAAMMASSYAYALAAILRFAGTHFGDEVARGLAFEMDEILTNGDFDSLNADVLPEGANSPSATQGLEFVIGAPAASGE